MKTKTPGILAAIFLVLIGLYIHATYARGADAPTVGKAVGVDIPHGVSLAPDGIPTTLTLSPDGALANSFLLWAEGSGDVPQFTVMGAPGGKIGEIHGPWKITVKHDVIKVSADYSLDVSGVKAVQDRDAEIARLKAELDDAKTRQSVAQQAYIDTFKALQDERRETDALKKQLADAKGQNANAINQFIPLTASK
jgi:hypothetical protein